MNQKISIRTAYTGKEDHSNQLNHAVKQQLREKISQYNSIGSQEDEILN